MKTIQYIISKDYTKKKVLQVVNILYLNLLRMVKKESKKYDANDFAIYPVSVFKIATLKKIVTSSSEKGQKFLDELDKKFMKELEKKGLKIYREVYER